MFEKQSLSSPTAQRQPRSRFFATLVLAVAAFLLVRLSTSTLYAPSPPPSNAQQLLEQCSYLGARPGPPYHFHRRQVSERFEHGTPPTLIRNATIWTGGRNGTEVIFGDLLLDSGIVKAVGYIPTRLLENYESGFFNVIDANGAWVTPGLFDLHSHIGLMSAPLLRGAVDVNSPNGAILPWLRSIDGLNTHDDSFKLTVSGGVTGGLILPGSGNMIGGQAFPIKYRKTPQRTPLSMVIEPPYGLNSSDKWSPGKALRWRHMKHATGENQMDHGTRMDTGWFFRDAYEKARQVKERQDVFCGKVEAGLWDDPEVKGRAFPSDLQWEALVEVLRGRVKVNCHTYETVDIDFLQRLTTEFEFPLAAIHHAHEAYLVPDTLRKMWGGPPAVAMFAVMSRYKRESYRGSEFAPKILADNGINVVMKSDHPVINSRYLLFEAQQAHYYGLPTNLALSSVITTPARAAGLSHRLGHVLEGYDADIVMWDSHPLTLGSTPVQVWIDGIVQIDDPHVLPYKGDAFQHAPATPDWREEVKRTLKYDGLPPLGPERKLRSVAFHNVCDVWQRDGKKVKNTLKTSASFKGGNATVVISNGRVECMGNANDCQSSLTSDHETINLNCGSLSLGLATYGSSLGLSEIDGEVSTSDGGYFHPLFGNTPQIYNDTGGAVHAFDGLQFEGRDTLLAYRSGVTLGIASTGYGSFMGTSDTFEGTSVVFRTGAAHALEDGAIVKQVAALHVGLHHAFEFGPGGGGPSVSTQLAAVRRLLTNGSPEGHRTSRLFYQAAKESAQKGEIPLIVNVDNRDVMVSLIRLKRDIEAQRGSHIKMTFNGGAEAHLIADEIAAAGIKVIVSPSHSFPIMWDMKRVLPGPPLSKHTPITALLDKNVTVAIGSVEKSMARNVMLEVAWAALDSGRDMSKEEALGLASTSLYDMFDINMGDPELDDLVAYEGDMFSLEGKVVAIISPKTGFVDIL